MILEDIKKVPVGADIDPETLRLFKAGAEMCKVNVSQFLSMVIHRRKQENFTYYDVTPKYGEITESTKQVIFQLSEEYKALLQEWAEQNNCKMTSIIRCLMDITVKNLIAAAREKQANPEEYDAFRNKRAKEGIIEECELHGVPLNDIIEERLEYVKANVSIRKFSKSVEPISTTLFDNKVALSDKNNKRINSLANRNQVSPESVKTILEYFFLDEMVTPKPTYCHVSKRQFLELKHIAQEIGFTPSKMVEYQIDLLLDTRYHTPELPQDEEMLRVNIIMLNKTRYCLEQFCDRNKIKMSAAVRLLINFIYNFYQVEGVHTPVKTVF